MEIFSQIIFGILLASAIGVFLKNANKIKSNILLGKDYDRSGNTSERWKRVLLLAFGQKKMFKRPIPALLHFFVYAGFLIVNLELLEIVVDGLTGGHRSFQGILGGFYTPLINIFEFFAVAVLISCTIFWVRRNITKLKRFHLSEMTKWPKLDANLILVFEIVLMIALLSMNATDTIIQKGKGVEQSFFFSDLLIPLYSGLGDSIHIVERVFWWFHIIGISFFANYVLYSKHLHIFLAFPNSYFSNLDSPGQMDNMDEVTNEVKLMLGMPGDSSTPAEVSRFGAKDVTDLSWKNLLDSYTCTECGRCTSNCPANLTGRALSPRKIMMDTRDRLQEVGDNIRKHGKDFDDGKSLLGDYITEEELFACTTCNACTEACPVSIEPVSIINQLRRYKIMEEAKGPQEWNMMFQNIETSFAPWKFPPTDRGNWVNDLNQ